MSQGMLYVDWTGAARALIEKLERAPKGDTREIVAKWFAENFTEVAFGASHARNEQALVTRAAMESHDRQRAAFAIASRMMDDGMIRATVDEDSVFSTTTYRALVFGKPVAAPPPFQGKSKK